MQAVTLGVDIGKRWFHLIGLSSDGRVVLREKLTREQLLHRFATHPEGQGLRPAQSMGWQGSFI